MHKLFLLIAIIILLLVFVYVETEFPFTKKLTGTDAINQGANTIYGFTIYPLKTALGLKVDPLQKTVYGGSK